MAASGVATARDADSAKSRTGLGADILHPDILQAARTFYEMEDKLVQDRREDEKRRSEEDAQLVRAAMERRAKESRSPVHEDEEPIPARLVQAMTQAQTRALELEEQRVQIEKQKQEDNSKVLAAMLKSLETMTKTIDALSKGRAQ
ncbi:hypothetical protein PTSG_07971 [Salpingoeca rosetta]|uniref:Uncharacterized protein n=1 Tax=Salpingoeca rosetta (strain ATCC 50818 / BSB-021) TaxID=946362 RepID=F2UGV5_SALR5|nr:uncharacterized protein PTSG_07971 [Salpingoeca rosetta]EGD75855.1 hypothetical protein PTSG_07971 [Salpingoeca rosetta]|eukprot:XP_004991776.1 hypothetical protein PTSG_07971 [Salpingoeca rosetta]